MARGAAAVIALTPIGRVRSPLTDPARAPKQGFEGAPEAWLELEPAFAEALSGLQAGQEALVLTWLHRADRETLRVHPRDDPRAPLAGVFATRSADRPNPIGIHRVRILEIAEGPRLRVADLEAIDGTPLLDLKPVLDRTRER